jgi:hypothetical protein
MNHNINSGQEYANLLINSIKEEDNSDLNEDILNHWFRRIEELAINSYNDYITGVKDDFLLSEEEMAEMYEAACGDFIQDIINGLVDKEMLQTSIDVNGDIVYSTTEKGKDYTNSFKND